MGQNESKIVNTGRKVQSLLNAQQNSSKIKHQNSTEKQTKPCQLAQGQAPRQTPCQNQQAPRTSLLHRHNARRHSNHPKTFPKSFVSASRNRPLLWFQLQPAKMLSLPPKTSPRWKDPHQLNVGHVPPTPRAKNHRYPRPLRQKKLLLFFVKLMESQKPTLARPITARLHT